MMVTDRQNSTKKSEKSIYGWDINSIWSWRAFWTGALILLLFVNGLFILYNLTNPFQSDYGRSDAESLGFALTFLALVLSIFDIVVLVGYLFTLKPRGAVRVIIFGLFLLACTMLNFIVVGFLPFYLPFTFPCNPNQSHNAFLSCENIDTQVIINGAVSTVIS